MGRLKDDGKGGGGEGSERGRRREKGRWLIMSMVMLITLQAVKADNTDIYSVVRTTPLSPHHLTFLNTLMKNAHKMDLDFWKAPTSLGYSVDIMATAPVIEDLSKTFQLLDMPWNVTINDVQSLIIARENPRGKEEKQGRMKEGSSSPFSSFAASRRKDDSVASNRAKYAFGEYRGYGEIVRWLNEIAREYPHIARVLSIGTTHEGRNIIAIRIGSNATSESDKRVVWVDGGIHAREWGAVHTALYFVEQLIVGYDSSPEVRSFVDRLTFYIVPVANPDGFEYTRSDVTPMKRLWRKNRANINCVKDQWFRDRCCGGVDLNRNFDFHWGGSGSSDDPCSEIYQGSSAFSERESAAIRDMMFSSELSGKVDAFITLHTYSQMWIHPYSHARRSAPEDVEDLKAVGMEAVKALESMYGTKYRFGTGADILYPSSGGSDDWAKAKGGAKYVYLLELRPGEEVWDGFVLDPRQLIPMGKETWEGVKVVVRAVMNKQAGRIPQSEILNAQLATRRPVSPHSVRPFTAPPSAGPRVFLTRLVHPSGSRAPSLTPRVTPGPPLADPNRVPSGVIPGPPQTPRHLPRLIESPEFPLSSRFVPADTAVNGFRETSSSTWTNDRLHSSASRSIASSLTGLDSPFPPSVLHSPFPPIPDFATSTTRSVPFRASTIPPSFFTTATSAREAFGVSPLRAIPAAKHESLSKKEVFDLPLPGYRNPSKTVPHATDGDGKARAPARTSPGPVRSSSTSVNYSKAEGTSGQMQFAGSGVRNNLQQQAALSRDAPSTSRDGEVSRSHPKLIPGTGRRSPPVPDITKVPHPREIKDQGARHRESTGTLMHEPRAPNPREIKAEQFITLSNEVFSDISERGSLKMSSSLSNNNSKGRPGPGGAVNPDEPLTDITKPGSLKINKLPNNGEETIGAGPQRRQQVEVAGDTASRAPGGRESTAKPKVAVHSAPLERIVNPKPRRRKQRVKTKILRPPTTSAEAAAPSTTTDPPTTSFIASSTSPPSSTLPPSFFSSSTTSSPFFSTVAPSTHHSRHGTIPPRRRISGGVSSQPCRDLSPWCRAWLAGNPQVCRVSSIFMSRDCRATCRFC